MVQHGQKKDRAFVRLWIHVTLVHVRIVHTLQHQTSMYA